MNMKEKVLNLILIAIYDVEFTIVTIMFLKMEYPSVLQMENEKFIIFSWILIIIWAFIFLNLSEENEKYNS